MNTWTNRTWIAAALAAATLTGCVGEPPAPETEERENVDLDLVAFATNLGASEPDDCFGHVTAAGDFDNDGYSDLAVGTPGEAPGGDPKAGVVFVFKGTPLGLLPWRLFTQETKKQNKNGDSVGTGLGTNDAGDRYGHALAVGDFNFDGVDDLAVGAPGDRASATGVRSGGVYIYFGKKKSTTDDRVGLQPVTRVGAELREETTPRDGDDFGIALAAGNFHEWMGDGDWLAIGATGYGADGKQQGAVFTWAYYDDEHAGLWELILAPKNNAQLEDGFGRALATGDLDGDPGFELVIGAPFETVQGKAAAGLVYIYVDDGFTLELDETLDADALGEPAIWGFFGLSLAIGDVDGDAHDVGDLVIQGSSKLFFYKGVYRDPLDGAAYTLHLTPWDDLSPEQFAGKHGEYFGNGLAIGQLDGAGPLDVAVGGDGVFVARGKASGPTPWKFLPAPAALDADANLGVTVSIGNFDGKGGNDIVAGAPGQAKSAGAVERWVRDGSALEEAQLIDQESTGP